MGTKVKEPISKGVAKVPVVMQLEALECGAACLDMILAYYEKWLPLEQIRVDCGVSRDGSNAKNIMKAARSYGLIAKGYRFEPEALRDEGAFPCIVHWNFNHFIVLKGFKHNKAYINDPARGEIVLPMKDFDEGFTGIVLMFEPGSDFVPSGKRKSTLDFVVDRLEGTKAAIAFVFLTSIISNLIGVINPAFTRIFYDRLLTQENPEWADAFLLALGIMFVIQIIVSFINTDNSLKISGKMAAVGSTSFMWKILRLPMEFFSQRMVGDILSRQGSNASIANTIVQTLAPLILNAAMMVFYFVVMIRYNVLLTFVGLSSIVVNTVISQIISKKRINVSRVSLRDAGKLSGTTVAGISMIESIKASGAEDGYFEKWAGYQASANNGSISFSKINYTLGIIPSLVSLLASTAIMTIGLYLTIKGEFTLGMITAFSGYLSSFSAPANSLISASTTLQSMRTEIERVDDVMRYPTDSIFDAEKIEKTGDEDFRKLSGNIVLKDVSFGYSKLDEPLIKDFNLTLTPGSRIALVGGSGCGKSTIAKLISGINKQWSGDILYDGKKITEIDRSVFTGSIAVVDQDIIIFEDTIKNNIKMWDESIEDFEVVLAAKDAQIHSDIMQREGGYDYHLTEGGKDFSGGQRQRLEIARVLAQDPTVVILDEATSALDAKTEYDVVRAIQDRGIACIVVAHRLSTIRDCDEIIVLDHGNVVERGRHEELIKNNGAYSQLITSD